MISAYTFEAIEVFIDDPDLFVSPENDREKICNIKNTDNIATIIRIIFFIFFLSQYKFSFIYCLQTVYKMQPTASLTGDFLTGMPGSIKKH